MIAKKMRLLGILVWLTTVCAQGEICDSAAWNAPDVQEVVKSNPNPVLAESTTMVNARRDPDPSGEIIGVVLKGTQLKVYGKKNGYALAAGNGCKSLAAVPLFWIREDHLSTPQAQHVSITESNLAYMTSFLEIKKLEALQVLESAMNNREASPTARQAYKAISKALSAQKIRLSWNSRWQEEVCGRGIATAYTVRQTGQIYYCTADLPLDADELNTADPANIEKYDNGTLMNLIHEAAHASNVDYSLDPDFECGATLASVSAMVHARRKATWMAYEQRCTHLNRKSVIK